jgi:hypothetical protein
MDRTKLKVMLVIATAFLWTNVARAAEGYFYQGDSGREASFYLIGGQYNLYVYAKRPVLGYATPESKSCFFNGNLQRVWPTHDAMTIGTTIPISTIVPYKLGPVPIALPAGLYSLYVTHLTNCAWHFSLESTKENSAGLAPVQMLRRTRAGSIEASTSASVGDQVQFYAQYRSDHDSDVKVSGEVQMLHDEKIVATFPLQVGHDKESLANVFYLDVHFEPSDQKYFGSNTARFVVKIGGAEFTSTGNFTLTPPSR